MSDNPATIEIILNECFIEAELINVIFQACKNPTFDCMSDDRKLAALRFAYESMHQCVQEVNE